MATQTVIDLNELVPADKRASLGDDVYSLPGDMPLATFLRIQRAAQAEKEDDPQKAIELLEDLRDALVDLFLLRLKQDGLKDDQLEKRRERIEDELGAFGLGGLFNLINKLYGDMSEGAPIEEAEGEGPNGTKSSKARKTTARSGS